MNRCVQTFDWYSICTCICLVLSGFTGFDWLCLVLLVFHNTLYCDWVSVAVVTVNQHFRVTDIWWLTGCLWHCVTFFGSWATFDSDPIAHPILAWCQKWMLPLFSMAFLWMLLLFSLFSLCLYRVDIKSNNTGHLHMPTMVPSAHTTELLLSRESIWGNND